MAIGLVAIVPPGVTLTALVVPWGVYALVDGVIQLSTAVVAEVPGTAASGLLAVVWGLVPLAVGLAIRQGSRHLARAGP